MHNSPNEFRTLTSKLQLIEFHAILDEMINEVMLLEASTIIDLFGNTPEGMALAKFLHQNLHISRDAYIHKYDMRHPNFAKQWKKHFDNILIVQCQKGWAVAKPNYEEMQRRWKWNPKTDTAVPGPTPPELVRDLTYDVFFAESDEKGRPLLNKDGSIKITTDKKIRTGALRNPDPRQPDNVLNLISANFGTIRQLWFLERRDTDNVKNMPAAAMSGKHSRNLNVGGASVERHKIASRRPPPVEDATELNTQITNQFLKKALPSITKMINYYAIRLRQKGLDTEVIDQFKEIAADSDKILPVLRKIVSKYLEDAALNKTLVPAARSPVEAYDYILKDPNGMRILYQHWGNIKRQIRVDLLKSIKNWVRPLI